MLDRIHRTLKFLANTEGRGNVKPSDIDLAIHNKVLEKFEELFFEVNRIVNRQNRGLVNGGLENLTDKVREKIQHYLQDQDVSVTNGAFSIPTELKYFDQIYTNLAMVELCKNNRQFFLEKSEATTEYPIGLKQGDSVKIEPSSITQLTVSYLRKPRKAKWTYQVLNGVELFNPSANDFQDVDIHPSEEADLTLRVLQTFGINLKEQDLQRITEQMKSNDFNKEITT